MKLFLKILIGILTPIILIGITVGILFAVYTGEQKLPARFQNLVFSNVDETYLSSKVKKSLSDFVSSEGKRPLEIRIEQSDVDNLSMLLMKQLAGDNINNDFLKKESDGKIKPENYYIEKDFTVLSGSIKYKKKFADITLLKNGTINAKIGAQFIGIPVINKLSTYINATFKLVAADINETKTENNKSEYLNKLSIQLQKVKLAGGALPMSLAKKILGGNAKGIEESVNKGLPAGFNFNINDIKLDIDLTDTIKKELNSAKEKATDSNSKSFLGIAEDIFLKGKLVSVIVDNDEKETSYISLEVKANKFSGPQTKNPNIIDPDKQIKNQEDLKNIMSNKTAEIMLSSVLTNAVDQSGEKATVLSNITNYDLNRIMSYALGNKKIPVDISSLSNDLKMDIDIPFFDLSTATAVNKKAINLFINIFITDLKTGKTTIIPNVIKSNINLENDSIKFEIPKNSINFGDISLSDFSQKELFSILSQNNLLSSNTTDTIKIIIKNDVNDNQIIIFDKILSKLGTDIKFSNLRIENSVLLFNIDVSKLVNPSHFAAIRLVSEKLPELIDAVKNIPQFAELKDALEDIKTAKNIESFANLSKVAQKLDDASKTALYTTLKDGILKDKAPTELANFYNFFGVMKEPE